MSSSITARKSSDQASLLTAVGVDTSVYVHFPWCLRKCPYCDFASRPIEPSAIPHGRYADALLRELEWRRPALAGRRLISVFFGGGTPSLWSAREVGRVLSAIRGAFEGDTAAAIEITAECNPSSLDEQQAEALREAGVGRLSIGVQSLSNDELLFLGRLHDAEGAVDAIRTARRFFDRVSADLIVALPGQAPNLLADHVATVLSLGVAHVSAYGLTIEPGTPFAEQQARGELRPMTENDQVRLMDVAARTIERHGLVRYEVSNFARPGEEARHNQHYWRGGCYVGLGAAAVGCLHTPGEATRQHNTSDPARYMDARSLADTVDSEEHLGPQDLVREALMLGLRTSEGVNLEYVQALAGIAPLAGRERVLAEHQARGNLIVDGSILRVLRKRWRILDPIVADLF